MKSLITCIMKLLFFFHLSFANGQVQLDSVQLFQVFSVSDSRDGTTYEAIRIGSNAWLTENLKLETANSHCPNVKRTKKDCLEGNFYPYQELDSLCPARWHIATVSEWEDYYDWMKTYRLVKESDITRDTFFLENDAVMIIDTSNTIGLFNKNNPLRLSATGWVQGRRWRDRGTITVWVDDEKTKDARFHLHIGPRGFVKHTHKHHIDDKKRRRRKFSVRCVMD